MKLVSPFQRGTMCQCKWPGNPAPAARPEIEADVVAVRPHQAVQYAYHVAQRFHRFQQFGGVQLIETALVRSRGDQKMAVVVRETVKYHHASRRAQSDQMGAVIVVRQSSTKETSVGRGRRSARRHIRQSPRRPKLIHLVSRAET